MSSGRVDERLGSYRLVSQIGRGGMGEVWRAEHVQIHSIVAIKLVLGDPGDTEVAARFLREARSAARIRHPGIVAVTDYGERAAGGAYMVMELLDGESLAQRLNRGTIELELAIELAAQSAEALAAAHDAGVIHRDLKPGNIFLVSDPAARGGVRVKLLDFGVAKATGKVTDEHGLTMTGALVGTPLYMAPEQCTSRRGPIDHRADLYALGVVIYEMLSGAPPFVGPTLGDVIEQHLSDTPDRLRVRMPSAPLWLDELVMLLLAKERDERPAHAAIVGQSLRSQSTVMARRSAELASTGVSGDFPSVPPPDPITPRPLANSSEALAATSAPSMPSARQSAELAATVGDTGRGNEPRRSVELAATVGDTGGGARSRRLVEGAVGDVEPKRAAELAAVSDTGARARTPSASGDIGPSAGLPLVDSRVDGGTRAVALAESRVQPSKRSNKRTWIAIGGIAAVGAAIGAVVLLRGGSGPVDLATLDERGLDAACTDGNGEACFRVAGAMMAAKPAPDLPRVYAQVQAACDHGLEHGCAWLAAMHLRGSGVRPDVTVAQRLAERACEAGEGWGCDLVGEIVGNGLGVQVDNARAQQFWTKGCELGNPGACSSRAKAAQYGLGIKRDPELSKQLYIRAASLAEAGCAALDPESCRGAGLILYRGSAGPKDIARGVTLIQKACDLGNADACADVGQLTILGIGVTKDPKRAGELLNRGCDRGSPDACTALSIVLGSGMIGPADPVGAMALAKRTCENHGDRHCTQVGRHYTMAIGAPRDPNMTRVYYERGCKGGDADACSGLAELRIPGETIDPDKAFEALGRACTLGSANACRSRGVRATKRGEHAVAFEAFELACSLSDGEIGCPELAGQYFDGAHVPKDPARATKLLVDGCDSNMQVTCHALGERLRDGNGMDARPAESAVRFEKACDLGYGKSCVALADMLSTKDKGLTPDPARATEMRAKACKIEPRFCPKPDGTKPDGTKPDGTKPDGTKPDATKSGDAKPGDAKPGDAKPGDAKPGDAKPDAMKPEAKKLEPAKPGPKG